VLVAERDGVPVGVAAVERCFLHGLYVVPEEWGSGVAAELHDAALEVLGDCPEVRLWTLEQNHRARRFYEGRGWRLNGETRVVPFPPNPLDVGYVLVRDDT
jgi:GNAT superfamily N-acetyltransferase